MNRNFFTMSSILILLAIGVAAGMLSGLVGVGGGIIIVPVLVYFLGYSQHHAQGTTLFLFMLWIFANDHYRTFTLDDLAFLTNWFY